MRTAAITNLGCKVNQSEMESAARLLRERGIRVVDGDAASGATSCSSTPARSPRGRREVAPGRPARPPGEPRCRDRRHGLLRPGRAGGVRRRRSGRAARRQPLEGRAARGDRALARPGDDDAVRASPRVARAADAVGVDAVAEPIEGIADGRASVERTRAFVKVQDGCSFFCTYCIIPAARGPERSLSPEVVLADVRRGARAPAIARSS